MSDNTNRRPIPGFPSGMAEDVTLRQLLWWMIIPMLAGAVLIAVSFRMKAAEFLAYRPPGWRIAVFTSGIVIAFLSFLLIVLAMVAKFWALRGWSYMDKGSRTANLFVFVFSILLLVPLGLAGKWLSTYDENLELEALRRSGVTEKFQIVREEFHQGKNSHYSYFLIVPGRKRELHELEIRQKAGGYLTSGHIVSIRYLPANPEYFRYEE